MTMAYINIGSNQGDRKAHIDRAVALISLLAGSNLRCSDYFESKPWGYDSTSPYLNLGVAFPTTIPPEELLDRLLAIQNSISPQSHRDAAGNYIDRIIDIFPVGAQQQIRVQLSMVLQAVVSQQLVPTTDNVLTPAFELMFLNKAIRNLIRESKIHQIDNVISTGAAAGMVSMDNSLLKLYREGKISEDTAVMYSQDSEQMRIRLR